MHALRILNIRESPSNKGIERGGLLGSVFRKLKHKGLIIFAIESQGTLVVFATFNMTLLLLC
jgi:hypothetical protein